MTVLHGVNVKHACTAVSPRVRDCKHIPASLECETLRQKRVMSSVLLPGPGVDALHTSISVRVHIALKATSGRGESETDCISLEGMFVFVTLRLTEGVYFALVRVNERGRGEG